MSERTKDSDLASAAKSLSWISPLVLLFSRIFHWCFFHETNRQKAEAFVSNLQEERLTSLIRETTLSIVDEQQEKRNTFTEGKYLLFRFLKPSAEFNFSTAEDRNQAGKLINDLYEAATLRCKAIVDEGKDVRTRDDNASALLINHH